MKKENCDGWYPLLVCVDLLSALAVLAAAQDKVCPAISDSNCSCYVFDDNVFLECPNVNMASLQRVLAAFARIPIQSLSLYDMDRSVTTVNADDFERDLIIRQLQISLSNVHHLNEDSFKNIRNELESLAIVSSKLQTIPQKTLPYLTSLHAVNFEANEIWELPGYAFYGLPLSRINLKANAISRISEFAFAGLEECLEEMDISENRLNDFPILSVRRLARLSNLKVAWNEIHSIPDDGYSRLNNLIYLDLSSNNFGSLAEDTFRAVPRLRSLSLYFNAIEGVHRRAFASLPLLESVDLSHNKIVYLDAGIYIANTKLRTIDLSHNHLHYISGVFNDLPQLRELFLNENNILEVGQDAFRNSTHINVVYLQQNAIRHIDADAFASLGSLQQLHLSENFIRSLSSETFPRCTQLSSLNLDHNLITGLDVGLFNSCTNLRELRLHNNKLTSIKREVFDPLKNLFELHLQYNQIEEIESSAFHSMQHLQHVNLQGNVLVALGDLFTHESSSLISVQMDSNRIIRLYNGTLKGQSNIQIMWLGHNQLSKINTDLFADLLLIQRLYINNNSINRIEDGTFEAMQVLSVLDLSSNELRTITRQMFTDLSNLEELYLASNKLQAIESESFAALDKLRILDLSNNRFTILREKIFNDGLPVEVLKLENCSIRSIEESVFNVLHKLDLLNLRHNYLTNEFIAKIEVDGLRTLDLCDNNLTRLADHAFKSVPSLVNLFLDGNQISSIEGKTLQFNNYLQILSLSKNLLKSLPSQLFGTVTDLREIILDENNFDEFPYSISSAASLKRVSFAHNTLSNVDFSKLARLKNITHLDLSGNLVNSLTGFARCNFSHLSSAKLASNMLTNLPTNFLQGAEALSELDLSFNYFKRMPSISLSAHNLPHLKKLNMTANPLMQIYEWSASAERYPLEELHIGATNLSMITSNDFDSFPHVVHLYMCGNSISRVAPDAFHKLTNLLTLNLGSNEIESMRPEHFQGLVYLRTLNVTRNRIVNVGRFTADLRVLQIVDVSYNRIERIERGTFSSLSNLIELYMHGNRIAFITSDLFRPLKKLRLLDLSINHFQHLPLNALRPLETQIKSLRIEENPLHCGCAQQEMWEWLRDHQKMVNDANKVRSTNLKCQQPIELRNVTFLQLQPSTFCDTPLVLKLAIQDIQPFSVIVSWQSRNHSGVYAFKIAYSPVSTVEYNHTGSTKIYDSGTRSVKLSTLCPNTEYLICVIGLSNSNSPSDSSVTSYSSPVNRNSPELSGGHFSRCTEIRTLDAGERYQTRVPDGSSIFTRRLGLIIGSCLGCVVFLILVTVLVFVKMKKKRKNKKNQQPLPPEYLSYRHFSLHGCDPLTMHTQRTTTLNL